MTIPEVISKIREVSGMSCTELGAHVGVSASAIYNYENDLRHPRHAVVKKLLNLSDELELGLSLEDFYPR